MTKTLKQILGEKPILFTADVPERVKQWLIEKQQQGIENHRGRYHFQNQRGRYYFLVLSELIEELEK